MIEDETEHEQLMRALKRIEMDGEQSRKYLLAIAVATAVMAVALVLFVTGIVTVKFETVTGGF